LTFHPAATIRYELRKRARIKLTVFDLLGREVRTLATGLVPAGNFEALWDGEDNAGRVVPSGEYLYRLETDGLVLNRKLTLLQ
jgi:flagellar hook assembly protein FlgD